MDVKNLIEDLGKEFAEFKEAHRAELAEVKGRGEAMGETSAKVEKIQDAMDALEKKYARATFSGSSPAFGPTTTTAAGPSAEEKAFSKYLRGADLLPDEQKSLTVTPDTAGGYLLPENQQSTIIRLLREYSPVRELSTVYSIASGNSLKIPKQGSTHFSGSWTSETGARTETTSGTFAELEIFAHEMYANPYASAQMAADAAFPLESWVAEQVGVTFAQTEATAFVSGNGVGKPLGLTDAASGITSVNSGDANLLTADGLINLRYALPEFYAANSTFIANRLTIRDIRKLKDGVSQYLWQPGLAGTSPATILDRPYREATDLATVAAGVKAIVFGDFRKGFVIVDRQGTQMLRDPYSSKPYIQYYSTRRVGGMCVLAEAFRIQLISA